MMPISSRATPRGRRVSLSSVMQYLTCGRIDRSPTVTAKLVSVAPRKRRLNSSIFPRLRSQPIHSPSRAFHWRSRWNRKKRSPPPFACLAFSAAMPARAASRIVGVVRQRLGRRVEEVAEDREVDVRVDVAERLHLQVRVQSSSTRSTLSSSVGTITIVRAVGRHGGQFEPRQPPRRDHVADERCSSWITSSLAGTAASSATTSSDRAAPAVRADA